MSVSEDSRLRRLTNCSKISRKLSSFFMLLRSSSSALARSKAAFFSLSFSLRASVVFNKASETVPPFCLMRLTFARAVRNSVSVFLCATSNCEIFCCLPCPAAKIFALVRNSLRSPKGAMLCCRNETFPPRFNPNAVSLMELWLEMRKSRTFPILSTKVFFS